MSADTQNQPKAPEANPELEELKAKLAAAEATISRIGDEHAKKMQQLQASNQEGKIVPFEVQGDVQLSLLSPEGGKPKKAKYSIKAGHPNIRLHGTNIVKSQSLMNLAMGKELSQEELADSPALKEWDKEKAITFLTEMASIQAGWLEEA